LLAVAVASLVMMWVELSSISSSGQQSQETLPVFETIGSQSIEVAPLSDDRKKLYNYHPPKTQGGGTVEECGAAPQFNSYFEQNYKLRSKNKEDLSIYNLFFKKLAPTEMKDFTYVEMGAFNGREESNSRFYDVCLGWKGLRVRYMIRS
jgi:hypothetical protein